MLSEITNFLNDQLLQTGVGMTVSGLLGFVVGYAFKKLLKFFFVAIGIVVAIISAFAIWLQNLGVIRVTVDYVKLNSLLQTTMTWATAQVSNFATLAVQGLAITGSAGVGFIAGFQKG